MRAYRWVALLAATWLAMGSAATAQQGPEAEPVPEPNALPPPPAKDTPEPPPVPPVPEPSVRTETPTPEELGAPAAAGSGREPGEGGTGGTAGPWWRRAAFVERLDITDQQAGQLDRAMASFVEARATAAGKLTDARRALLASFAEERSNAGREALEDWTSAQHALIDARAAFLETLVETLDESQLSELARQAPRALAPGGRGGASPRRGGRRSGGR